MVRELSPELAKIARDDLNENPKRLEEDLQHLKEWISKQPHLRARTDDQWLVGILRACKFSLEKVKKKLDLYYTLRTTAPDVTLRIKPSDQKFVDFLRLGTCIILPKAKDQLLPRVILIRPGAYDPSEYHVFDVMCILYYTVQVLLLEDDSATILGVKIVTDYEGVTFNHASQATSPSTLKKMIAIAQDSMPLRLKGNHHVRIPSGIEKIFTLIRVLLNEKAKERMRIHKTTEELLQYIPKETIPTEYGGSGGTFADIIEYWAKKIVEYKTWMQQEEQLGTDETKRPGKPQTASEMFGMGVDGSFRKLDID